MTLANSLGTALLLVLILGGSWLLWSRCLSFLFLPAQVVYAVRQAQLEETRKDFLQKLRLAKRLSIPVKVKKTTHVLGRLVEATSGGGHLDGVELPSALVEEGKPKKYFVHFNANGVCYEEKLESMYHLQRALESNHLACNMVSVNYRGVGYSSGKVLCGDDLVEDAKAVLKWICENRGVSLSDIAVHGHSIGGAAACLAIAQLVSESEQDPQHPYLVADRTFYSLRAVVEDKLGTAFDMGPIGALIFANVGVAVLSLVRALLGSIPAPLFGVPHVTVLTASWMISLMIDGSLGPAWPLEDVIKKTKSRRSKRSILYSIRIGKFLIIAGLMWIVTSFFGNVFQYLLLFSVVGSVVGAMGLLNRFALVLVGWIGWEMELAEKVVHLNPSKMLITYHALDGMIPPDCSLAHIAKEDYDVLALSNRMYDPHMLDLFAHQDEAHLVLARLIQFYKI